MAFRVNCMIYIFVDARQFSLGEDRRYLPVGATGPDACLGGLLALREVPGIATDWVTEGSSEVDTH